MIKRRNLLLLVAIVSVPVAARADAILPSLVLVWPITILLLIPVILLEALYTRKPLQMGFWESVRVVGVANLLSTLLGLPLAHVFSEGVQYFLDSMFLRSDKDRMSPLQTNAIAVHDRAKLVLLGLYPRWILLVSAGVMLVCCFLISWFVEAKWIARNVRASRPSLEPECSRVVRNANLLSYALLVTVVLWILSNLNAGLAYLPRL